MVWNDATTIVTLETFPGLAVKIGVIEDDAPSMSDFEIIGAPSLDTSRPPEMLIVSVTLTFAPLKIPNEPAMAMFPLIPSTEDTKTLESMGIMEKPVDKVVAVILVVIRSDEQWPIMTVVRLAPVVPVVPKKFAEATKGFGGPT